MSRGARPLTREEPSPRQGPLRGTQYSVIGGLDLLLRDELQQGWATLLRLADAALDGGYDLGGVRDAFAIPSEGARHIRIVAADVGAAVPLSRRRSDVQRHPLDDVVER